MDQWDIVEFPRGKLKLTNPNRNIVAPILGGILKLIESDWDGWGWHLGIAYQEQTRNGVHGWIILESIGKGVDTHWRSDTDLSRCRTWKWFKHVNAVYAEAFKDEHLGDDYDVNVYFWTGIAIIFRHYWNRRIPRLLDDRYTCWELVQQFAEKMGKPICSPYDVIIICDMIKALKEVNK